MENKVLKYLFDIKKACELILEFIEGKTFNDYVNNNMLNSAVERQFLIIGEALNQVIKLDLEIAKKISETRKIVNFRNLLSHEYSAVSPDFVWGIINSKLPILYQEISSLLEENKP